nr:reverse transcriptase domain-containing protein [Tanacetum cinerariifolium]
MYLELSTQSMTESPLVDSSLVVPVFSLGDDPIACLNKAMDFLIAVASKSRAVNELDEHERYKSDATSYEGTMQVHRQGLLNATNGKVKDIWLGNALILSEQGMHHDPEVPDGQAAQTIIRNNTTFQTEDLDTYDSDFCTTCGRRHPGECRRAAGTCFKCGQAGHLKKDYKKNTTAGTSGQADKKPGASGRVFAITEGHAANTSGTITGTLFIYGHAVFVLCDTSATHSVISSAFASRITMTPTLLDHVLCISTPMQDSVRITHVYRNLPLQFDDKIRAINVLPLDICEFDLILGKIYVDHFCLASTYPTVTWL